MVILSTTFVVLLICHVSYTHISGTEEFDNIIGQDGCNLENLSKQNVHSVEELLLAELLKQKAEIKALKNLQENKDAVIDNLTEIRDRLQTNIDKTITERDELLKERDEDISELKLENIDKASQIDKLQNDLQSCQTQLYNMEPQLRIIKRQLFDAQQSVKNVTQNSKFLGQQLENELIIKQNYQKELRQEKQNAQIATMILGDSKLYSTFLKNFLDFQKKKLDQCQNITQSQDILIGEMKQGEENLIREKLALQKQVTNKQTIITTELAQNLELTRSLDQARNLLKICQNGALSNEASLEERIELSPVQSSSLQAFQKYLDIVVPEDYDERTWICRNQNGTVTSAGKCQCIPEPTKESHLQVKSLQLSCETEMILSSSNSLAPQETYEIPCSYGKCRKMNNAWPQCAPVLQKQWSDWIYTNCSKIIIGNSIEECGSGSKRRRRMAREAVNEAWIEENEIVKCTNCFRSLSWSSWGSCNHCRRTRHKIMENSMNPLTNLAFKEIGIQLMGLELETETESCSSCFQIRGGPSPNEGNIFYEGGPICDDNWHDNAAKVVCRMLGYHTGTATTKSRYGAVSSTFTMDQVICNGNENSILDCSYSTVEDCGSDEGAGVICT